MLNVEKYEYIEMCTYVRLNSACSGRLTMTDRADSDKELKLKNTYD